ncbi:hypothetical protein PIB30_027345 [Stylosanthes scabra]|uniref:Uncharacterized protein n=1 Tax=Stylosanthes scabra TaxID=79078 RepID=A0ABU6RAY2_9FABA|nr:hypothetical protein [Stylosanthes scabra]
MSQETATASSPSEINVQLPKRTSKISYSRDFLFSLAKADGTVKLPREVKLSFPCVLEDASGLLSPPFCVPDSGCHERLTLSSSDNANHLLHRSNEPYRPPCRYKVKALPLTSKDDGQDLLKSDTPGSAESTNQDKAKVERERRIKATVRLPKEDIWYSSKNTDSEEYSGTSLIQPSIVPKATKVCSLQNQQMRNPQGTPLVMEPLQRSKPSNFLSQENSGNKQKNHGEVEYETLIQEFKLSNIPICVHVSPRGIGKCDLSELDASISPPHVEDDKKSSSYSSSIDGRSNSSFELCLPDEDCLICFDGPFLMSDAEKLTMVNDSISSSSERSPYEVDIFSPSSPRDMIEKLVESLLNDESYPAPHRNDPIVHHGAGLEGYGHLPHAQRSYTQFCPNQLNLQRDEQEHSSFQMNSIDSAMYSSTASHSHPSSSTACQHFALSHDELRRFHDQLKRDDIQIGQSKFQQKINAGKRQLSTLSVSQGAMTPLQNLNSAQSCSLAYLDPRWSFL